MFWWPLDEIGCVLPGCSCRRGSLETRGFIGTRFSTWRAPLAGFPAALAGETLGWGAEPGSGSGSTLINLSQEEAALKGPLFHRSDNNYS